MSLEDDEVIVESSGNVFADLGFPDADELYAKAVMSIRIGRAVQGSGKSEADIAAVLGTTERCLHDAILGRLSAVSTETLADWEQRLAPTDS